MGSSFARYFQPDAGFDPSVYLTPEEQAQQRISDAYRSAAEQHGPVAGFVSALGALKYAVPQQSSRPEPATVSGGSVIGLMPEQTNALLDRVQRQNAIDQQMWQHEQDNLRAEAQARQGYVFRASEAERRQRAEQALEQKRIENRFELENYKRAQGDFATGPNGEVIHRKFVDGKPVVSVVSGAPEKKPTPRWAQVQGPEGPVWADLNNQSKDAPTMPVAVPQISPAQQAQIDAQKQSRELRLSEQLSKIPPEAMPDEEKVKALKQFRDSGDVPLLDYVDKEHKHYQTDADGNLFVDGIKQNPEGWQTKPDKASTEKISEDLLRVAFKDSWNDPDTDTQDKANYLWAHKKSPEEIARILGPPTEPGMLYGTNTRYTIPSIGENTQNSTATTQADTAPAPQDKTIVERRTAKDGTKMVKYSDGTIGTE